MLNPDGTEMMQTAEEWAAMAKNAKGMRGFSKSAGSSAQRQVKKTAVKAKRQLQKKARKLNR